MVKVTIVEAMRIWDTQSILFINLYLWQYYNSVDNTQTNILCYACNEQLQKVYTPLRIFYSHLICILPILYEYIDQIQLESYEVSRILNCNFLVAINQVVNQSSVICSFSIKFITFFVWIRCGLKMTIHFLHRAKMQINYDIIVNYIKHVNDKQLNCYKICVCQAFQVYFD